MRCEFGFCMVCDRVIATACPTCNSKRKTSEYTEVEVAWSNGSRMKIAVCTTCASSHAWDAPEAKQGITQAHWDAWDKSHGKYSKEIVLV